MQILGRCMRRSVAPRNVHIPSISVPSIQPSGRRKQIIVSTRFTRPLITTSSQPQEQTQSTSPSQLQSQSSPPTTTPRVSEWDTIIRTPRPHGTYPSSSPQAREDRDQHLQEKVEVFDIIPERGSRLMNKVETNLTTHDARNLVHLRLTPMLGRTLPVEPGTGLDLQSAFRMLELRCTQNRVRQDHYQQRVHVRRGQKRKELKSKRWRALFKEGFLKEVGRIRRMKGQGW